jgi:SET domain-containing protein
MYSIDATLADVEYGVGRFLNHSSDKYNLRGHIIRDKQGALHACFLSNREIKAGEELLIHYGETRRHVIKQNPSMKR